MPVLFPIRFSTFFGAFWGGFGNTSRGPDVFLELIPGWTVLADVPISETIVASPEPRRLASGGGELCRAEPSGEVANCPIRKHAQRGRL